jgi:glutathione S-transferase
MIVYGHSLSPYVRKVLAFAAEKGIEIENRTVGLGSDEPEFLEASPFRKMPGFRDGDFTICDSTAIVTYLEAVQPDKPLIPAEPKARARTIWYEEFADTILMSPGRTLFYNRVVAPRFLGLVGDDEAANRAQRDELPPIFDYLERTIPEDGFLVDGRLTLADIAVASPFANLQHVGAAPDPEAYPRTTAYIAAILSRPSFAPWIERERSFLQRKAA